MMQVERLEDDEFIDWLWDKFQLHKKKIKVQNKITDLMLSVENGTFKPSKDKVIYGFKGTPKEVKHIVKDSPQRQFALLGKELRDIEDKERGGFKIKFGGKGCKIK